jgi:hypothetical protein
VLQLCLDCLAQLSWQAALTLLRCGLLCGTICQLLLL